MKEKTLGEGGEDTNKDETEYRNKRERNDLFEVVTLHLNCPSPTKPVLICVDVEV